MDELAQLYANKRIVGDTNADNTTVHPIGLTALLFLCFAMLVAPRKYALWPLIFMGCFITSAQRVVIFSLDFHFMRIMILFGVARILMRREFAGLRVRLIDAVVLAYIICFITLHTIQQGSTHALVYQLGVSYDMLGLYFVFRCLIRSWNDFHSMVLGFIVVSIPLMCAFLLENATGRNLFSALGGVPEITKVREGKIRCVGAYAHAILAGCFWAALLPLMAARWFDPRQNKIFTILGIFCALVTILCCASSTPLMGVIAGVFGACLFPFRRWMKAVRWLVIAMLLLMQLMMKSNVWTLIARVNLVGGSTGYHRLVLIEKAVQHFNEWCLFGTPSTAHWGWGMNDVTNQFVIEGVRGGFLTLLLFVTIIVLTYRNIGQMLRIAEQAKDFPMQICIWSLGVMMFVHITSFIGVSYFGQITILYWMTVGVSASLNEHVKSISYVR